uniref:Mth938 domain-containing protein n=1 Tax=Pseudictyota dubia TaxID=2749911 RepID=A0A7R9Z4K1_9STRA|mmetsp:Transcript_22250/g.41487  ORF Transcript_22250/g.41487 Transcript_22250/m.41487 type:complete len:153 (+) Transcript_22250:294-752(+)|eukprot:CAMPEP_0197467628 /NCGR_PEP_ID=MMETSP1175-20131217/65665_1 /TAXON_ID=1003142 /ORGANISM="Triceratium dubium, Strain CCMP147" /LENGTH=152 /DNA_ID=CAMNT_0043003705 /DNA_START=622 /DNA_END=1080 /DNA_ORIENTATION=+
MQLSSLLAIVFLLFVLSDSNVRAAPAQKLHKSPKVTDHSWGNIFVETRPGKSFKNVKLYPGGAKNWKWSENGTKHRPGIAPGDVDDLLDAGATTVVLSKGVLERLHVRPDTMDKLNGLGIDVEVLQTDEAVARYNELVDSGVPVGALIHSTC